MKKTIKTTAILAVFAVSYLGVNYSKASRKVAGKTISVSSIMLSQTSSAYCNEATYWQEVNSGVCSAAMNHPNSECLNVAYNNPNCVR